MTGKKYVMESIFSDSTLLKNIWCYLTNLNLLKYFISADEDLPPSYVKRCRAFLKKFTSKQQASALKQTQLKRIADAIEEILRLVKKDMEPKK